MTSRHVCGPPERSTGLSGRFGGDVITVSQGVLTRIGVLAAELDTGPTPAARPTSWGESVTHRPQTHSLRRWSHGDARVGAESAAALGEIQDPAAVKLLLRPTRGSERCVRSRPGMGPGVGGSSWRNALA